MLAHDRNLGGLVGCYSVYAFVAFAVYIIGLIVYRIHFHPLASYPGPFFAKFSDFYSTYHAWKADRHIDFHLCHEKYGPVFRYGPNRLSFNTHTALNTIYSAKANVRKADFYHALTTPAGPNLVSVVPKDMHARKRRVLSHAFSDKAIKSMEEYMLIHIRSLCDKLASTAEPIDISEWFTYMAGDVLGELCFGNSFELLNKNDNRYAIDLISGSARLALICGCTAQLANTLFLRLFFSKMTAGRLKYRAFALERAESRTKATSTERRDFYHYLMEAKNPETDEKYSLPELWAESNNFIVAGTDTSALALSSTLFYLTHNKAVLDKAKTEIRSVFAGRDIEDVRSGPELNACKYLRACLDEALRMTPPVPGMLPRTVLSGGIDIDGHSLPPGVEVGIAAYALHHNSTHFSDSFEYRPERFLGEEAEETQKHFTPFSTGPRACIGKNMAYMEMMITLARVLLLFDFKSVGTLGEGGPGAGEGRERRGEYQVEDAFICGKSGPLLSFVKT